MFMTEIFGISALDEWQVEVEYYSGGIGRFYITNAEKPETEVWRATGDKEVGWILSRYSCLLILPLNRQRLRQRRCPPAWHIWEQSNRSTVPGVTERKTATEGRRASFPAP